MSCSIDSSYDRWGKRGRVYMLLLICQLNGLHIFYPLDNSYYMSFVTTIDLGCGLWIGMAATINLGCYLWIGIVTTIWGAVYELELRPQLVGGAVCLFGVATTIVLRCCLFVWNCGYSLFGLLSIDWNCGHNWFGCVHSMVDLRLKLIWVLSIQWWSCG